MQKLVIFDVCNTLVTTNSTYSYIDYLISKGIKPWYKLLFHSKICQLIIDFFSLIFRMDCQIYVIGRFFKGLDVKKIYSISMPFFSWYKRQVSPRMMEIIINENNSGSHIVLLSAAINPPIDYLSKEIGIESYSSKLKESKGFYTGDIVPLWGKKEKVFRDDCIKLSKYSNVELYTDNKDDINLMKFLNENNSLFYVHILPYKNTKYREKVLELYNIKHEIMG